MLRKAKILLQIGGLQKLSARTVASQQFISKLNVMCLILEVKYFDKEIYLFARLQELCRMMLQELCALTIASQQCV